MSLDIDVVIQTFGGLPATTVVHGTGRGAMTLGPEHLLWAFERAAAKTEVRGECWWWTGYCRNGYGCLSIRNAGVYLHVLSCALAHGAIPPGHEVLHGCDNRPCWLPSHLRAGTRTENVRDMWAKQRAVAPPRMTGVAQHLATLTDDEIAEIRQIGAGPATQREIAAAYGCSQSTIWRLLNGKVRV